MTTPVEQMMSLMQANGQFLLKMAEITRSSGAEGARIGSKAAATFVDQFKASKPGMAPTFRNEGTSEILGEIEKVREATLEQVKDAFEEWREVWTKAVAEGSGPQALTDVVQRLVEPLLKTSEHASEEQPPATPQAEPGQASPGAPGSSKPKA